MNIRKNVYIILSLMGIVGLCACTQSQTIIEESGKDVTTTSDSFNSESEIETSIQESEQTIVNKFPESFKETDGNIQFDISEIHSPPELIFYDGSASKTEWDVDGMIESFLSPDIEYEYMEYDDGAIKYEASDSSAYYYNFSGMITAVNSAEWDVYSNCVDGDGREGNLNLYTNEQVFDFGTAEEVYREIKEKFAEFGLNLDDKYRVVTYYLDYETLAANETGIMQKDGSVDYSQMKSDWSEEDNAYMFYIYEDCQGLQDNYGGYVEYSVYDWMNAAFVIAANAEGIIYIEQNHRVYDYSLDDESIELMQFPEIAKKMANHYAGDGYTYEVTDAVLFVDHLIVDGEMHLVPVWAFVCNATYEDGTKVYMETEFNAIDGKYIDYRSIA